MVQFDVQTLTQTISFLNFTALKGLKDLLPEGQKRVEVEQALSRAEQDLKRAEAEAAKALGYELCKAHWPPTIMLAQDEYDQVWQCPQCGREIDLRADMSAVVKGEDPWS